MEIAGKFMTTGKIREARPLGPGFINDTFIVVTEGEGNARYILQRKNHIVFPDVPGMMKNIELVTEHIRKKVVAAGGDPLREVLTVITRRPETMTEAEKRQFYDKYIRPMHLVIDSEGNVSIELKR